MCLKGEASPGAEWLQPKDLSINYFLRCFSGDSIASSVFHIITLKVAYAFRKTSTETFVKSAFERYDYTH